MTDANAAAVWDHVKAAVARSPALGLLLALFVPLVVVAGAFLAPFALPLIVGYYVVTRGSGAAPSEARAGANAASAASDGTSVASVAARAAPAAAAKGASPTPPRARASAPASEAAAPAPLTGSAALMAKMRKSGAVTGERRVPEKTPTAKAGSSNAASPAPPTDSDSRFFILYGGEASTQIARDLAEKASTRGFSPRVVAMDDFKSCDLDKRPAAAIFVVETIENAQPAEAAGTCLRFYIL